jgi:hypothetical protein
MVDVEELWRTTLRIRALERRLLDAYRDAGLSGLHGAQSLVSVVRRKESTLELIAQILERRSKPALPSRAFKRQSPRGVQSELEQWFRGDLLHRREIATAVACDRKPTEKAERQGIEDLALAYGALVREYLSVYNKASAERMVDVEKLWQTALLVRAFECRMLDAYQDASLGGSLGAGCISTVRRREPQLEHIAEIVERRSKHEILPGALESRSPGAADFELEGWFRGDLFRRRENATAITDDVRTRAILAARQPH